MVRGINFDLLPSSIIATYSTDWIDSTDNRRFLSEVERGDNYFILEVSSTSSPSVEHSWQYFATPDSPPRSLVEYTAI